MAHWGGDTDRSHRSCSWARNDIALGDRQDRAHQRNLLHSLHIEEKEITISFASDAQYSKNCILPPPLPQISFVYFRGVPGGAFAPSWD